ncbi:MAG: hypothetical protein LIO95_09270 [Clostridiales bacterium]|nr:hypothetical protein [Clostridiales bacterium]
MSNSPEITVPVQLDAGLFRSFFLFDALRRQRRWVGLAVFSVVLLVCAGVCLSQMGARQGALLMAILLAAVAVAVPAVYAVLLRRSINQQSKALGLERPHLVYRITVSEKGVAAAFPVPGKKDAVTSRPWAKLYGAWRVKGAVYLYPEAEKVYILPDGQVPGEADDLWALCAEKLGDKAHDLRRGK